MSSFWSGKNILITGHTGFKGSWLSFVLSKLGAKVTGYSVDIPTVPSLFEVLNLKNNVRHELGNVCDPDRLNQVLHSVRPEIVFHLAAQSLVLESYRDPITTYQSNVMGTIILLDSLRRVPSVKACVVVTTDKCYQNLNENRPFKETDPLGGYDPYSSSKACTEIVTQSMRQSFFWNSDTVISTMRAGNVIGGGDWAENRIVTDIVRALTMNRTLELRNPAATRPWQHVLDPIFAYMKLARYHFEGTLSAESFNIGPDIDQEMSVEELARCFYREWGVDFQSKKTPQESLHEATYLKLDNQKAKRLLNWRPVWDASKAISSTAEWFRAYSLQKDMVAVTQKQLDDFLSHPNFQW